MSSRFPLPCAALAALALLCAAPMWPAAADAPDPSVSLTKAQTGQFQAALDALAAQGHVALVAEGAPLKPRLRAADAPDLTAGRPLGKAITALAAAYDYDAKREDGGVFTLTKRYTDPADLPCVTLEECRQAAQDLTRVLDALSPHLATSVRWADPDGERDAVLGFFGSLSPDQAQAAQTKALHYADLSPEQRVVIQTLSLFWSVQQPAMQIDSGLKRLDNAQKSVLTAQDEHGSDGVFIQEDTAFVSLSGASTMPGTSQPMVLLPLPSAPAPATLAAVVAGLSHAGGPVTVVDAPLRAKPLTVAGLSNAAPPDVLHAIEALYTLRIGATDAGVPELERRPAPTPASLRELAQDVWLTLPAPYARALHIGDAQPPAPPDPADWQASLRQFNLKMHTDALPNLIRDAAIQRVLLALQPQVRLHGPGVRVPVATLDQPARAALAVALMAGTTQAMQSYFDSKYHDPVVDCLESPDAMVIYTNPAQTGHINGQSLPSIHLEEIDPLTGKKVGLGGIMYGSYP